MLGNVSSWPPVKSNLLISYLLKSKWLVDCPDCFPSCSRSISKGVFLGGGGSLKGIKILTKVPSLVWLHSWP